MQKQWFMGPTQKYGFTFHPEIKAGETYSTTSMVSSLSEKHI
jgi:hypothetical protein